MKYAVIQIAGKQVKVAEGDLLTVNRMQSYNPVVLAYSQDDTLVLGNPVLEDVKVDLTPQSESKLKTIVFRYKSKSRYRKTKGHKQPLVTLKVESISKGGKSSKTEEKTEAKEAPKTEIKTEKKAVKAAPKKTSTKKEEVASE